VRLAGVLAREALVLWRDRAGLLLVLLMPTALAVIVTLIQEDAFRAVGGSPTTVLMADLDDGPLGEILAAGLESEGGFRVVRELDGATLDETACSTAAAAGRFPACVVIPAGASRDLTCRAEALVNGLPAPQEPPGAPRMDVEFDPAARFTFRRSFLNGLKRAAVAEEAGAILDALDPGGDASPTAAPEPWGPGDLLAVDETSPTLGALPSSVQQNMPAWTVFAMFLIVVPLSGTLIQDREQGMAARMRTLPVSPWTLLLGRMLVYVGVCLVQALGMAALGRWVLPRLGTPVLDLGDRPVLLLAVAVSAALAATALGVLVGSVLRTRAQAAVLGATFTVIAAALGGVMVPAFLMPRSLQPVVAWSPLHWALDPFLAVILRGAGPAEIAPDVLRLLAFSGLALAGAVAAGLRRE
jgi:ABC-2 type transport system permease protein